MTAPPPLSPPENVVTLEMESLPDDVMSVHVEEVSIRRPGQMSSEFVWIGELDYYIVLVFKTDDILGLTGIHSFHLRLDYCTGGPLVVLNFPLQVTVPSCCLLIIRNQLSSILLLLCNIYRYHREICHCNFICTFILKNSRSISFREWISNVEIIGTKISATRKHL